MEIAKKYDPSLVEDRVYQEWMNHKCFTSIPDNREPYTVVIPPPNVTGILHMGHMLNNTIQDILVRKARLDGKNACWIPGTDHASIATEAKVVNKLKEEGKTKEEIGREQFLNEAWDWTHKHGGIILEQLKKLGSSCDWDRTKFTLDHDLSDSVVEVFIDLFNRGLIYRGFRILNWDPEAKTNISDEEVIYKDKQSNLYYLKYHLTDSSDEFLMVATTRPETIFGDIAVAVNPEDERYKHLIGKTVRVPLVNREVPIIADDYVSIEFGTGCLKITPAHDKNDFEIGQRHNLEIINVLNDDATLNQHAGEFANLERFVARKQVVKKLEEIQLLEKVEQSSNKVGTSERTGCVIEPRPSVQWFVKMDEIVKPAIEAVKSGEIKFYPDYSKNTYFHWLENIKDWNISRQLWWGHRIPVYYFGDGTEDFVVARNVEEAQELAANKLGREITKEELRQDEDVLDTWFSSWLWPLSVFNGVLESDNEEVNYYYPTADLVTAPDIIFFWVARMIMAGKYLRQEIPFKNVYFTGIVRDKQGRKMSKQLGNSPDALKLIEEYGADAVRVGLLMSSAAGNDLLFDESLCLQGRNFANKFWNSFRLVKTWKVNNEIGIKKEEELTLQWMKSRINYSLEFIQNNYEKFRLSYVLTNLYKLVWEDYCSWFLEAIKPTHKEISKELYDEVLEIKTHLLKLLHPFMPFITEEIWQLLDDRKEEEFLMLQNQPEKFNVEFNLSTFEEVKLLSTEIRNLRNKKGLSPKERIRLETKSSFGGFEPILDKIVNVEIELTENGFSETSQKFLIGKKEFAAHHASFDESGGIDVDEINSQIEYLRGFKTAVEKKLGDKRFVDNAPAAVVDKERKKLTDAIEKINKLKSQLDSI